MKKIFLVLLSLISNHSCLLAQQEFKTALNKLYETNKKLFQGNIYLCDTAFYEKSFNYEYAKNTLIGEDLKIAKVIIEKGMVVKFSPKEINNLLPLKLKLISLNQFESLLQPEVQIEESEKESIRMLDSLNTLSQKFKPEEYKKAKPIYLQIDSLHKDKNVMNYYDRAYLMTKRLMILHQIYQHKSKFLFFFTIYRDMTNSENFIIVTK